MTPSLFTRRELARSARGGIEAALDRTGWRWNVRLSLYLDLLVVMEERAE